jgi:LmbE family N-acetylglucosaminyl deacetylase
MSKSVLVVAAHADDEALGCGGTIARHATSGDQVHVVFVADGVMSRLNAGTDELARRQKATEQACEILGIRSTTFLGLPDNRLDSLSLLDIVQPLEAIIARLAPELVYTHHYGDLNIDHRQTHHAVMTACRPLPDTTVREILAFEVMSSTEWSSLGLAPFLPNLFVDIGAQLDTKMRALEAYGLEMRAPPHSRSLMHLRYLAQHHGCCVGVDAAEAFMVMRAIR